jgi:NO-binding membrane sensor protein with MHYT domain
VVLISVVLAVVVATAALWLAFNLRGTAQMVGSALVMGVAARAAVVSSKTPFAW